MRRLRRDLPDQRVPRVDVLDRELIALQLVFALHRVSAGARHRDADEDGVAGCAARVRADGRLVGGEDSSGESSRQRQGGAEAESLAKEASPGMMRERVRMIHCCLLVCRRVLHNISCYDYIVVRYYSNLAARQGSVA